MIVRIYFIGMPLVFLVWGVIAGLKGDWVVEGACAVVALLIGLVSASYLLSVPFKGNKRVYFMGVLSFIVSVILLGLDAFIFNVNRNL